MMTKAKNDINYEQHRQQSLTIIDNQIGKEILQSIESISYGEVVVTVHDHRIVQIEKKEKKRF